jgi:hypothetical protein
MVTGRWLSWLKWPITLALLSGVLAGAYYVNGIRKTDRAAEAGGEEVQTPRRARHGVITLSSETVEEHGIEVGPAQAIDWSEPITVYGRLVPNPRTTSVVQAPFAGALQAGPSQPWPTVGASVKTGHVLGQINVRVGPQERLDLQLKLKEARLKVQGAEKVVAIQQEHLDRLEKASRGGEVVSQKELNDARVLQIEARTNLSTAQAAMDLWKGALEAIERQRGSEPSTYSLPLTAPGDGEVVETVARPGMSLEAGAPIARIVDFRRPLAQLDFPPDVLVQSPPGKIELAMLPPSPVRPPAPSSRLMAELIGPAPQVDPASQFSSFWYEATIKPEATGNSYAAWRPGRFVTASLRLATAPKRPAVAVPVSAVLTHQGRLLVYVQQAPGKFARREVRLLGREGDRAVLAAGVRPSETVVVRQAQVLLSEEFRSEAEDQ